MYPTTHLPRFNYWKDLLDKIWDHPYFTRNRFQEERAQLDDELDEILREEKKEENFVNRQQDLPAYSSDDYASRLYYLNRRNTLNVEYFEDQLNILKHLLKKSPVMNTVSSELPRAQMLNKQISFLTIQKNRIHEDLEDCHNQLKEAVQKRKAQKLQDVKEEEARIDMEIDSFLDTLAYTKSYLYQLLKKHSPVTA